MRVVVLTTLLLAQYVVAKQFWISGHIVATGTGVTDQFTAFINQRSQVSMMIAASVAQQAGILPVNDSVVVTMKTWNSTASCLSYMGAEYNSVTPPTVFWGPGGDFHHMLTDALDIVSMHHFSLSTTRTQHPLSVLFQVPSEFLVETTLAGIASMGWRRVAFFANNDFGGMMEYWMNVARPEIKAKVELRSYMFDQTKEEEVCAALEEIRRSNWRIIFYLPFEDELQAWVKCATEKNMFSDGYQWIGGGAWLDYISAKYRPYFHRFLMATTAESQWPQAVAFSRTLTQLYPQYYFNFYPPTYEEHLAYNSIIALAIAIKKLRLMGVEPQGLALADAIFATNFTSTVGPISFEPVSIWSQSDAQNTNSPLESRSLGE